MVSLLDQTSQSFNQLVTVNTATTATNTTAVSDNTVTTEQKQAFAIQTVDQVKQIADKL